MLLELQCLSNWTETPWKRGKVQLVGVKLIHVSFHTGYSLQPAECQELFTNGRMGCEANMVLNILVRFVWVLWRWRHRVLLKYGYLFHKLQGITSYKAIILMEDWFYSEHVENARVDIQSASFHWYVFCITYKLLMSELFSLLGLPGFS